MALTSKAAVVTRRREGWLVPALVLLMSIAIAATLCAPQASAHRVYPFGGQYPHTAGTNLYLPYMHMTSGGYISQTNSAMYAWYDTPTRVWPYQTMNYSQSKIDVYTQWKTDGWWGMAINKPCSWSGCSYSYTEITLNSRTMAPETTFTQIGIIVHEVGHALGLSHVCGQASCPAGSTPTIMQWGRLAYNTPRTHDINDTNAIYR